MFLFFSYDTRSVPFTNGSRWSDVTYLGNRAYFKINTDPPVLVLTDILKSDQAVYTCKVDYIEKAPTITKVNLTVIGKYITFIIYVINLTWQMYLRLINYNFRIIKFFLD